MEELQPTNSCDDGDKNAYSAAEPHRTVCSVPKNEIPPWDRKSNGSFLEVKTPPLDNPFSSCCYSLSIEKVVSKKHVFLISYHVLLK